MTPRSTHSHAAKSESVQPWPGGPANIEIDPFHQRPYVQPSGKVVFVNPGEVPPAGSIPYPSYSRDALNRFASWLERESTEHGRAAIRRLMQSGIWAWHEIGRAGHAVASQGETARALKAAYDAAERARTFANPEERLGASARERTLRTQVARPRPHEDWLSKFLKAPFGDVEGEEFPFEGGGGEHDI
jgi:hypothetical protein